MDAIKALGVLSTLVLPGSAYGQSALLLLQGTETPGFFGNSVSSAGDANLDGFADIIIGDPWDGSNGKYSGAAKVFSGLDGKLLYAFLGDNADDGLGAAVGTAGDADGDGYPDLIVATAYDPEPYRGSVRVYSGADGTLLATYLGEADGDWFGYEVEGAGDVDGDGLGDIIVGAPNTTYNGIGSGSVYVISSGSGQILYRWDGDSIDDLFGYTVASAGDVDADGVQDIIVGAVNEGSSEKGAAYVYSGSDGTLLHTLLGSYPGGDFGSAVAGAGDVNGDGHADVIVGDWVDSTNGTYTGKAKVFSGADGSLLHVFTGANPYDEFGFAVAGAGDWDSDGFDDVVFSAPHGNVNGEVRIHSGFDGSLLHTIPYTLDDGNGPGDAFGFSLDTVADLDGDGFREVLIGALRGDTPNGADTGSAWVYSVKDTTGTHYCGPANPNSTGESALIDAYGSRVVYLGDLRLEATKLPANKFGYFLVSKTQGFVTNPGGSQGNLCLGGAIGRYTRPGEVQNSGPGGTFSLTLDLGDTPQPGGAVAILVGETWSFQAWFRDKNPLPTSNFTDGIEVEFY